MSRQNKVRSIRFFRLSLADAESHEQIWALRFTRLGLLVILISAAVALLLGTYMLIAFTPVRTFIPGYPDAHTQKEAISNAIRIDSLENVISRWEVYSENLVNVMTGQEPLKLDSVIRIADSRVQHKDAEYLASQDSLLRVKVNEAGQFEVSGGKERDLQIQGMHFFIPLKGVISKNYDSVLHPYVDITAPANSVVMSVLDGTVIFDGWNDEGGYTMAIQHDGDIVSVYKHNQKLLKKTGDKVSAGASIALVGNSETAGDHLHFELWHKGEAVDPNKYIAF